SSYGDWSSDVCSSDLDVGQARTLRSGLAQLAAVVRHGPAERLRALRAPTLVISGDADRIIPVENSYRLAALIPGARLHVLHGARSEERRVGKGSGRLR